MSAEGRVTFNSFTREPAALRQAELVAAAKVLDSSRWVLGERVEKFEAAWAKLSGTTGAVGVGNGLDAIEICLRALKIGQADEVITTPVSAYATTLAIQRCGAVPVFADINPSTACLDPAAVERCISPKTKAVLVVHIYGRIAELDKIEEICKVHGLYLVEDCAQAHGASFRGTPVGSIGHCAAWSFYPTKNLGAVGDAGAITSSDSQIIARAQELRNYGQRDRYHHDCLGLNSRLDELQAALLLARLPYLRSWNARRRKIADDYYAGICSPLLQLPAPAIDPESHVHHLFVVRTDQRKSVMEQLDSMGIDILIHYPVPCHHQRALRENPHRIDPSELAHAERHCATCFSLPLHPLMDDKEVARVITACNHLRP